MRSSPFLTPDRGPGPSGRRRRPRPAVALALVLVLAAAGAVFLITRSHAGTRHARVSVPPARGHAPAPPVPVAPALSPTGLPLRRPSFTLTGLGTGAQDPVQI